jgi:protein-disulfide isomerase
VSEKEMPTQLDETPFIATHNKAGATPQEPEVFRMSGDVLTTALIAFVFLAAGIFMGLVIAGFGTNSQQIRVIVEESVRSAVDARLTALEAVIASGSGNSVSAEELSALVQQAIADASKVQNFRADNDPFMGVADAPIVVVEFSDFYCSFCGRHFQQTLTPLLETYDGLIKYVYRDFPSVGGDAAQLAAMAAECANDQGKFWEFHNAMFTKQDDLRTATTDADSLRTYLVQAATDLELDIDTFSSCYDNQTHLSDVIGDATDAQLIGARGTPAFLVNGQFVSGAQSYEYFANIIDGKLRELGIEPPQRG